MTSRSIHIDAGKQWRGGQRQVLVLAEALRARGHEPLLIGSPDAPLVARAHDAGLATATSLMRGDWDIRAARKVRALIRTWRPHVVHAHDARGHAIALLALAGIPAISRPPLIVTRRIALSPKSVRFKYGPRVARFIAISQAVKDAMVVGGIEASRIDIVYSGVPAPVVTTPRDWRAERGWPADSVVVGVVGAMTSEKGLHLLNNIAHAMPAHVRAKTRLVLLGGEQPAQQPAQQPAHERHTDLPALGIETYSAGFVTDIHNAMSGLDLLWHPAIHEGLGTSLIDALALGVPPIAFAVGGIPEIIRDGIEGRLVPPGDTAAFATIHQALMDPEARNVLAQAGPPRAADFSVEKMTSGVQAVYDQTLVYRPRTRRPH